MEREIFSNKDFSADYCKLPMAYPEILLQKILSYLMEKKGKPFGLAVDVGCGTGRSTRVLAPYFDQVIGIDESESMIKEAQACQSPANVSYMVCSAEAMTLDDSSVDLVTAAWAVHWFDSESFLKEANRILKPRGCLAMFTFIPKFDIRYDAYSDTLTAIFNEISETFMKYLNAKSTEHAHSQYGDIYDAVPFVEKERVTDLMITYQMSIQDIIAFIKSVVMYHIFKKESPMLAEEFLQNVERRFRDVLKDASDHAKMDVSALHCYVLACKQTLI